LGTAEIVAPTTTTTTIITTSVWFLLKVVVLILADNIAEAWIPCIGGSSIKISSPQSHGHAMPLTRNFQLGGTRLTHSSVTFVFGKSWPFSITSLSSSTSTTTALSMAALPDGYQEYGTFLIQQVAREQFSIPDDTLSIEWKPGRIVVTVRGDVFLSNDSMDGIVENAIEAVDYNILEEDMEDNFEDIDDNFEENDFAMEEDGKEKEEDGKDEEEKEEYDEDVDDNHDDDTPIAASTGVDVAQLARAINVALDDSGVGLQIATTHEIEVTTPGASNELSSRIMFQSYQGFEVLTEFQDLKTQKVKTVQGRLVERNNEFTIINIKGRIKKFNNDMVISVKLPKAKKEKGVTS
jgi:ribosome maturation factor RimP